jgi:hypothetical protein
MALTPAFISLKILSNNASFSLLPFTVDHLGGLGPLAYCLLFSPDQHKALGPTPSPIFEWNVQIVYSTQWPMDLAPILTYYTKLAKIGPTHTHIPDTDPPTTPPSQIIGHYNS